MTFKPGESGNPGGKWKPGQSGNPSGRPKSKPYKEALQRVMEKMGGNLDEVAAVHYARALTGDMAAIKELGDRMDGKVPQALVGDDEHPPIKAIVTGVIREGDV